MVKLYCLTNKGRIETQSYVGKTLKDFLKIVGISQKIVSHEHFFKVPTY